MRKGEIKIGDEYCYSRTRYGGRFRVHVLETGVDVRSEVSRGSRIVMADKDTGDVRRGAKPINVPNRSIRSTWAEEVERLEKRRQEKAALYTRKEQVEAARDALYVQALRLGLDIEFESFYHHGRLKICLRADSVDDFLALSGFLGMVSL